MKLSTTIIRTRSALLAAMLLLTTMLSAQNYHGTTGLLQVPNAEMGPAGTFRGSASFLHKAFTPDQLQRDGDKYNTFGYAIGLTAFRWIEVSYAATLLYMHKNGKKDEPLGYYNEDRHMNVKVNPLYEGRWWPAIALGMDDIGRFKLIKSGASGNNYFQNLYIAATKHFDIKGFELGVHVAYRYYSSNANSNRRGVAGGITFVPRLGESLRNPRAWLQRPRLIVEWDGIGVNVGADVLLWRHLFVQASLIHGYGFTGGLSYHYTIPF